MTVSIKKRLPALLTVALCVVALIIVAITSIFAGGTAAVSRAQTEELMMTEYEIYPKPHSVEYGRHSVTVTDDVAVSFGKDIDGVTRSRAYDVLSILDCVAKDGEGNTRVLIGVYGSGDDADEYIKAKSIAGEELFAKIDSYVIYIGENGIVVVGKDTDAVFYGLATLDMIFRQADGKRVRELTITDYSDCTYRGFIEGYYGLPWTTDERIELMRFGSKFKSNIYIYAPKDDPYHSSNWRGLYKGADLAALKDQITAGAETKTLFTWAIHPFMDNYKPIKRSTYKKDMVDLLAKLRQVYDAGCRQFMVSADDISEAIRDGVLQRDVLNAVQEWLEDKGDCGDLIFVSSSYCDGFDDTQDYYYSQLMDGLSERVVVMWTGAKICCRLSNGAYERFDELTGGRQPFMWMNWPVSDYCTSNLLMGAGEVFDVELANGSVPFAGVVVNPMQYAEQSKISIFAAADYCWNVDGFDVEKSYADCFKYIDSGAPDALMTIAQNMTNPNSEFDGGYFAESMPIKKYIDSFTKKLASGGKVAVEATNLSNQLDIIISAVEEYERSAVNIALRDSIRPWAGALKTLAIAAQKYLELEARADVSVTQDMITLYNDAKDTFASMSDYTCPVLYSWLGTPKYEPVIVAPRVLMPFMSTLIDDIIDKVATELGIDTGVIVRGFGKCMDNTDVSALSDNDPNTCVHFEGWPPDGAYVRVDQGSVIQISSLRLLNGTSKYKNYNAGDDSLNGYIECSENGKDYIKLCDIYGSDTAICLKEPVSARYIRIVSSKTYHYAALRELYINSLGDLKGVVSSHDFGTPSTADGHPGSNNILNIYDGDANTFTAFNKDDRAVGGYVEVDMLKATEVSSMRVSVGNTNGGDTFGGHVEYSSDGETFTKLFDVRSASEIYVPTQAIEMRYIRLVVDELPGTWMAVREIAINCVSDDTKIIRSHNFGVCSNGTSPYDMLDGDPDTFAWYDKPVKEGDDLPYVEIDCRKVISFATLNVNIGLPQGGDAFYGSIECSEDGVSWTKLCDIDINEPEISYTNDGANKISFRYLRIYCDAPGTWVAIREVTVA